MTARSTRDAYGVQLNEQAFEPLPDPDRPVIIVSLLVAGAFAALWAGGALVDRARLMNTQDLMAHHCVPVDSLAGDRETMLWHCADGYRISSTDVVDAR